MFFSGIIEESNVLSGHENSCTNNLINTAFGCYEKCKRTTGCVGFTWYKEDSLWCPLSCWLKDTMEGRMSETGLVSGVMPVIPLCSTTDPIVETETNCPNNGACPAATTDSDLTEWGSWSSCQLSLDRTAGFEVRNRECSTRHCSDALQEEQSCSHSLLTAGEFP